MIKRQRFKGGQKTNSRIANDKKMAAMNVGKSGDNVNFKRSIEIRNGIAIRSTNNVHRMTNAITLNTYIVSHSKQIIYLALPTLLFCRQHNLKASK